MITPRPHQPKVYIYSRIYTSCTVVDILDDLVNRSHNNTYRFTHVQSVASLLLSIPLKEKLVCSNDVCELTDPFFVSHATVQYLQIGVTTNTVHPLDLER